MAKEICESKRKIYEAELRRIKDEKGLTPENVLEEAKKKTNPLHNYFDWDDTKAAKKWRREQANKLILQVRITYEEVEVPEFVQVNISKEDEESKKEYVTQADITENISWREQVLNQALKRIKYWQTKYRYLSELNPIFEGIDKVEKELNETKKEKAIA